MHKSIIHNHRKKWSLRFFCMKRSLGNVCASSTTCHALEYHANTSPKTKNTWEEIPTTKLGLPLRSYISKCPFLCLATVAKCNDLWAFRVVCCNGTLSTPQINMGIRKGLHFLRPSFLRNFPTSHPCGDDVSCMIMMHVIMARTFQEILI